MEEAMASSSDCSELTLFATPQLLFGESSEQFGALSAALVEEIKPSGIVERIFVSDIASLTWEIMRFRRCAVALVDITIKNALSKTVYHLEGDPEPGTPEADYVDVVKFGLSKPDGGKEVLKLLAKSGVDLVAVEAKAVRANLAELNAIDRMLRLLESRRNRAFRSIADYKNGLFAKSVREASNQVIEADVIQLESPRREGMDRD
jgi:hypothetical protein